MAQLVELSTLETEPQWAEVTRHNYDLASGYLEWKSIRVKDVVLLARENSVQSTAQNNANQNGDPKTGTRGWRRKNVDLDHQYHTKLGQCQYFLKIQEDKVKDKRKKRELLFQDFKKLGLKNKRLEDELKSKKGNPSKRIKLTESSQRELEEAQKQTEEQQKLTKYWKKQTQELRGKMAEERQVWENKYKADTKEQSREIKQLKFKLRAEKIERVELRAENQSIRNAIRAMEQSLR